MESATVGAGRRRGRWWVLAALGLALGALIVGIAEISTQKPDRSKPQIEGIGDAQQIFGGIRQDGDRIGPPDAPVAIQVFNDLQCGGCRDQFLATTPTLVEELVRPGDARMEYRHYSFSSSPEQLGFFGAEAAAEQGYGWQYTYLFFRNQDEAKRVGLDEDFMRSLAGAIAELDVGEWQDYLDEQGGADGEIGRTLAGYEELGANLGIRAKPAAIVSGPGGTRTLQDGPTLGRIQAAVAAVG
ncbi:MAG: thioredoxin domain-containing protein [Actinomycetota bacterium]